MQENNNKNNNGPIRLSGHLRHPSGVTRGLHTWNVPSTTTLRGKAAEKDLGVPLFFPAQTGGIFALCIIALPPGVCWYTAHDGLYCRCIACATQRKQGRQHGNRMKPSNKALRSRLSTRANSGLDMMVTAYIPAQLLQYNAHGIILAANISSTRRSSQHEGLS